MDRFSNIDRPVEDLSGVLYECGGGGDDDDDKKQAAPLLLCYLGTGSRELSDRNDNQSVFSEIDSTAYCPQCLKYRDVNTAVTQMKGCCDTCRACPHCQSPLQIMSDENSYFYHCGYCRFNSKKNCHPSILTKITTTNIQEDLNQQCNLQYEQHSGNDEFQKLLHLWATPPPMKESNDKMSIQRSFQKDWDIEKLEQLTLSKQNQYSSNMESLSSPELNTADNEDSKKEIHSLMTNTPINTTIVLSTYTDTPYSVDLPYPIPLHTRKIHRCRKELAAGRTGILIKPKPNPLEGDSSLRSGHGQWWKKDSSAIHMVPKVTLLKYTKEDKNLVLILKIQNPTLLPVSLQIGTNVTSSSMASLENVIIDPIYGTKIKHASVLSSICNNDESFTDVLSLEPMEDAALRDWKNLATTENSLLNENQKNTNEKDQKGNQILASHQDQAFVQIIFPFTVPTTTIDSSHVAVPLQLRIITQPGSTWEYTSKQPRTSDSSDANTFVKFNLYILCPSKSLE